MPQLQLPIFYDGVNPITNDIGYEKRDGTVIYFCGSVPIFSHAEDDLDSFRTITSQLYVNGNASQAQIARAFGIKEQALKRWVKRYREKGAKAFYQPRKTRGKATVLTPEVREKAQIRLDQGSSGSETAKELGISYDVVRKAIADGRLSVPEKKTVLKTGRPIR
jgi:DNA-binding MarR family transcriptional regulator